MKKILFWILTFLWIWLSFCNAQFISTEWVWTSIKDWTHDFSYSAWTNCFYSSNKNDYVSFYDSSNNLIWTLAYYSIYCNVSYYVRTDWTNSNYSFRYFSSDSFGSSSSCPDALIDVQYNSWNTSTITCDWINYITIDWLSTLTNSSVNYEYTPYFNIDYKDEDNQSLIESYSNSILYLSGWLFKKTYTWDNDWILSIQWNSNPQFTWYTPVFDVTWFTDTLDNWNVFNNFSDNALKVLLSNIPSYIQYITIFFILLFLFWFIRRFKRKR